MINSTTTTIATLVVMLTALHSSVNIAAEAFVTPSSHTQSRSTLFLLQSSTKPTDTNNNTNNSNNNKLNPNKKSFYYDSLMDDFRYKGEIIDPYKILRVDPKAESSEIKRSYWNLSKTFHPDAYLNISGKSNNKRGLPPGCLTMEQATDKFQKIKLSYEILSVPQTRAKYNRNSFLVSQNEKLGNAYKTTTTILGWGVSGMKGIGKGLGEVQKNLGEMKENIEEMKNEFDKFSMTAQRTIQKQQQKKQQQNNSISAVSRKTQKEVRDEKEESLTTKSNNINTDDEDISISSITETAPKQIQTQKQTSSSPSSPSYKSNLFQKNNTLEEETEKVDNTTINNNKVTKEKEAKDVGSAPGINMMSTRTTRRRNNNNNRRRSSRRSRNRNRKKRGDTTSYSEYSKSSSSNGNSSRVRASVSRK